MSNNTDPVQLSVDDLIETRVTGVHHTWPVDEDTTRRLQHLGQRNRASRWRRAVEWLVRWIRNL